MSANTFARLCSRYGISPEIALEDEAIRAALKRRDDKAVERLLRENF